MLCGRMERFMPTRCRFGYLTKAKLSVVPRSSASQDIICTHLWKQSLAKSKILCLRDTGVKIIGWNALLRGMKRDK